MATATTATHRVSLKGVPPDVESLLLWRDVKKSALVLGGASAVYFFLCWNTLPLGALLLRGVAIGTLVCAVWATAAGFFHRAGPPVPAVLTEGFTEDAFTKLTSSVRPQLNKGLALAGQLASGKDLKLSAKVGGAAFAASWLLSWLPVLGLAYTVILLAFSVPKLYELRKDDADKYLGIAKTKFDEVYAKVDDAVLKKLPFGHAQPAKKEQ